MNLHPSSLTQYRFSRWDAGLDQILVAMSRRALKHREDYWSGVL